MKQACNRAGWERVTTHIPEGHHFALIRHPVDRWFTGIREYIENNRLNPDDVIRRAREGRLVWNQHTTPQTDYLPDGECELIPLEAATRRVEAFGLTLPRLRERWSPVYPDLIPAIRDYYAEDMGLYGEAVNEGR